MNDALPAQSRPVVVGRSPAVLVVDDEADLRELLSLTLVRLGLDVDTAESVAAARALLEHTALRAVPDGHAAAGRHADSTSCGKSALASGPPIAVITAYGSAENAVAALKAGAFDYLTKPVDLDQLRMLVRSAVSVGARQRRTPRRRTVPALARLTGEAPAMQQLRANDPAACQQHGARDHSRRIGERQGARRARDSRCVQPAAAALRPGELRRNSRDIDGGGVLRLSQGGVHRAPIGIATASSRRPQAERCSSTKLRNCPLRCR